MQELDLLNELAGLYDEDYFIVDSFKKELKNKAINADAVLNTAAQILQGAGIGDEIKKSREGVQFVVDMTPEIKRLLEKGDIKLDCNKAGEIFAQIRDAAGKYGTKLPIKQVAAAAVNPMDVANALQMKAIEKELNNISDTLDGIEADVKENLKGQQNDRLGTFKNGLDMFLEGRNIKSESFKQQVYAQALKTLGDANAQELIELKTAIEYLSNKEFDKHKKNKLQDIDSKILEINKCFDVIHKSYILRAEIYFEQGENEAMISVFEDYCKFMKRIIIPYANFLREYDVNDTSMTRGKWEKRADMIYTLENLKEKLSEHESNVTKMEVAYAN